MAKLAETRPGAVHGRLTVLGQYRKSGKVFCVCACECGTVKAIYSHSLGKLTNSCGCLQGLGNRYNLPGAKNQPNTKRLHRLTERERRNLDGGKVRAYRSWDAMWQRVLWPSSAEKYAKYQTMAHPPESWLDFDTFFADMGECPENYTLDRKDTRLGYSKENCRWASRAEQVLNRECNIFYSDGQTVLTETELAKILGLSQPGLKYRKNKGRLPDGWRLATYEEAVRLRFSPNQHHTCPPTQPL